MRQLNPTCALLLLLVMPQVTAQTAISDIPLGQINSVPPNVMFILDESGSMAWSHTPDTTSGYRRYVGYRNHLCNPIYFNPALTYTPPVDYTGAAYTNASFSGAWYNGYSVSSQSASIPIGATIDLSTNFFAFDAATGNTSGGAVDKSSTAVTRSGTTATVKKSSHGLSTGDYVSIYNSSNSEWNNTWGPITKVDSGTFTFTVPNTHTTPAGTNTGSSGSSRMQVYLTDLKQAAYYYEFSGSGTPTASQCKEDLATTTSFVKKSITSSQQQNFANWFSYYRTRLLMMKTVSGEAFHKAMDPSNATSSGNANFRVGFTTIHSNASLTDSKTLAIAPFYGSQKQSWFTMLYGQTTSSGTPLREALLKVGKMYQGTLSGAPDPILSSSLGGSCQQNFAILSTDGYWNDECSWTSSGSEYSTFASTPPSGTCSGYTAWGANFNTDNTSSSSYSKISEGVYDGGGSFGNYHSGGYGNTLADVAQYFYMTDLRSTLPDLVKKGSKDTACTSTVSGVNYCHQHMVTHTIGLIPGTMYFRPDYEVATPGSTDPATGKKAPAHFYDITQASAKCAVSGSDVTGFATVDPTTGTETAAGSGTCNWPKPVHDSATALDDLWHAAVNGRGKFYLASDPVTLKSGLQTLLNAISGAVQTSGASLSTATLVPTNSLTFSATFDPNNWSGEVAALVLDPLTGQPLSPIQQLWSAGSLLDAQVSNGGANDGWDSKRKIVTYDPAKAYGSRGVPFRDTGVSSTQLAIFQAYQNTTSDTAWGKKMINYLRGDMTYEGSAFRDRGDVSTGKLGMLGDIVNSKPVVVDKPVRDYADAGYDAFKSAKAGRTPVLYVGANDGMLHAIDASANYAYQMDFPPGCGSSCTLSKQPLPYTYSGTTYTTCTLGVPGCYVTVSAATNSGAELWAYVPNLIINGTAAGLPALSSGPAASPAWSHHYYVDGSPVVGDVDFANTSASVGSSGDWRTLLVGGLNKGGKGYFALDITDGATATSESSVGSKVLWEFTDADMGYSFAEPIIAKTRKYGWVVVFTSGYGNADGKGYIYVVDAKTGSQLQKLSWSGDPGSVSAPTDLGKITGYTFSHRDMTLEQLYAGDMKGRLWRVDVSSTDTSEWVPGILATLTDSSGNAQPITTTPWVEISANFNRYVLVGTGRWLDKPDMSDAQVQAIYAVKDGDNKSPVCKSGMTLPNCQAPASPLTRSDMTAIASTATTAASSIAGGGWYTDLDGASGVTAAQRVTVDPKAALGVGAWAIKVPNTDPCAPNASGVLFVRDLDTAGSVLTASSSSTTTVASTSSSAEYVLVGVLKTLAAPSGPAAATVGFGITDTLGNSTVVKIPLRTRATRFSWREASE